VLSPPLKASDFGASDALRTASLKASDFGASIEENSKESPNHATRGNKGL